jgi:hypothetical protein
MSALLTSHSNIAIPSLGSNMWTYFYRQHGDLSKPGNFERCLTAMLRYKNVHMLNPDVDRIHQEFRQGEPTYARLFALFLNQHAERAGKGRWGDKISYVERYADPIMAAYPDAVIIHMIRDPRDRYASAIKRWPHQKGQVGGETARWLYSVRLAQQNLKRYPGRYKMIRYETFVSEPERTLRELCAFLGEDFEPAMFSMSGAPGFLRKGGNSSFGSFGPAVITTGAVGRFRKSLSKREVAFIEACTRREMQSLGYLPEQSSLTLREMISYYLTFMPSNFARMVAWRALEAIRQTFPSRAGRVPMSNRILAEANQ